MDLGSQETGSSLARAKARGKEGFAKRLREHAADAKGIELVLRRGNNNVAVACPGHDALRRAARRRKTVRKELRG